ncbi:translation initiation factor IF-2 [Oryctolagus cuniculus]|uniref:translation initiation factor IF-2 n=1 Tax=Oryctolagus cuniculus TaxID=9986 RepID=UPI0022319037|nr:homeobox protein Nkx-6.1 [Oryctolagus cuniculus]
MTTGSDSEPGRGGGDEGPANSGFPSVFCLGAPHPQLPPSHLPFQDSRLPERRGPETDPRQPPSPALPRPPEKSGGGAWSGARGYGGGARPRARAAGAARPHLPYEAPATHPNDVPQRPSRPHRRLFRLLHARLVATAPSAAAVAAVLAAAAAAAARARSHAQRRGRARASARWRHLATDRPRAGESQGLGPRGELGRVPPLSPLSGPTCWPSRARAQGVAALPAPGCGRVASAHVTVWRHRARHCGWQGPGACGGESGGLVQTGAGRMGSFCRVQDGSGCAVVEGCWGRDEPSHARPVYTGKLRS